MATDTLELSPPVPPPARSGAPSAGTRAPRGPSSRLFLPAFSIAAVAAALVVLGMLDRWGGASFAGASKDLHVVVVGP
ncbi:MAG: hypothetical protein KGJ77_10460, partial [Acidobacteriota bacterium]|nr:hypothetical protein [Acidobacteriota bacterium]